MWERNFRKKLKNCIIEQNMGSKRERYVLVLYLVDTHDRPWIDPEPTLDRPNSDPGSTLNRPWIDPESILDRSKSNPGSTLDRNRISNSD